MKKVINHRYAHLEAELLNVVDGNYTPDVVYCNKRNKVEKITIEGKEFVIKTFKPPHIINRVVYRFLRKSKARRAYEYALRLLDNGIETPYPVAYFEKYKKGLFKQGIFIAEYVPYKLLDNVYEEVGNCDELDKILSDFVVYIDFIHKKGVVPMDMNAANVFYYKNESCGKYDFAITDINRIEFGRNADNKDCMRSLEQCFYPLDKMCHLVNVYVRTKNCEFIEFEVLNDVLNLRVSRRKKVFLKYKMRQRIKMKKKNS